MMRGLSRVVAAVVGMMAVSAPALAATEIQWWHAMTGVNNEVVETLAREFNDSQTGFKVVPVFKGTYNEALNAGIAAFRAHQPPHILQVFDVGTGTMMAAARAIRPVAEVMKEAGVAFDPTAYLPGIAAYYSTPDGQLLSFPFNSSSPVLLWNKAAFRKAGLDPDHGPKTWPEVWDTARKLKAAGSGCGYTSTWLTWIHLENFAAWNDLPYATLQNGLAGPAPELEISAAPYVKHFQAIADLARDGVFVYGGRTSEAKARFLSGECAMTTESSAAIGDSAKAGLDFGVGPMPYDPDLPGAPQNTIPGGASLWVFAGKPEGDYKGVAEFLAYLSQTPVQVRLHQVSGYMPVTLAAYEASKASGFYDRQPGWQIPILQMTAKPPTANSKGIRILNLPQVRDIENEEFEAMLAGRQDAATALAHAQDRGNAAIRQAAKALQ